MNILKSRHRGAGPRSPEHTPDVGSDAQDATETENPSPALIETWTRRNEISRKIFTGLLYGALAAGPIALGLGGWNMTHNTAAVATTTNHTAVDQSGRVGLFARDAVVTWLTATQGHEAQLKGWFPMATNALPTKTPKVSDAQVASVDQVGTGQYNARIAVTVGSARQYLQVPVYISPTGGMATLAMPQPVAGMRGIDAPENPLVQKVSLNQDLAITMQGFVAAYAAGNGDVTRYTSPGSTVAAIAPAPYTTVKLTSVSSDVPIPTDRTPREGGTAQVELTADATGKQGTQSVSWLVTVRVRAARWEVVTLDSVPGIRSAVAPQNSSTNPSTQAK